MGWEDLPIEDRFLNFLKEYEELCRKYGVYVSACGCCLSPWMVLAKSEKEIREHIDDLLENYKRGIPDPITREIRYEI